jgi:Catalytic LigB subunit of aromatic ring-opening dioxygenase
MPCLLSRYLAGVLRTLRRLYWYTPMGEVLGIGCTHGPQLQFPDANMADILRRYLSSDSTPAELKDPRNWPAAMRREWADDEGLAAAGEHRRVLVEGFRRARQALDDFNPDFVLIWGDDQYENFKEDLVPPFALYGLPDIPVEPYKSSPVVRTKENVWGQPEETRTAWRGHPEGAGYLSAELINSGFDVSCAYAFHHAQTANHAFVRTVVYLDYDQTGFPYPIVPFHVNCYGSDLWQNARNKTIPFRAPPSPPPWRCYDLGKRVAEVVQASPWRVALIGSSSWSHAFLTAKHGGMYPDVESDRLLYQDMCAGNLRRWRDLELQDIRDAGQHEVLNWVCLAGAMEGRRPEVLAYSETYLFNSDKAVVLFPKS